MDHNINDELTLIVMSRKMEMQIRFAMELMPRKMYWLTNLNSLCYDY